MTKCFLIGLFGCGLLLSGCATSTCEDLCEWFDGCRQEDDEAWGECQEVCEEDYSDGANYCRDALHRLGRCVSGESCDDAWSGCEEERIDALDDCKCLMTETTEESFIPETCLAILAARP
jgi:hypothetical protein